MAWNEYPYTDFHEMNMDWIISKVKELIAEWAATKAEWNETKTAWELMQEQFADLKAYVDDYFDNLDVQQEINNKLDEMLEDGTLSSIIYPYLDRFVNYVTPEMLGAVDESGNLDASVINAALEDHAMIFGTGNYTFSDTIVISHDNRVLKLTGALTYTGENNAFEVKNCERSSVVIGSLTCENFGDCVLFDSDEKICQFINFDFINMSGGNCIKINATYGTQCLKISGKRLYAHNGDAVHVEVESEAGWIGEIRLCDFALTTDAEYGIYVKGYDASNHYVTGLQLFAVSVNAVKGLHFENAFSVSSYGLRLERSLGLPMPFELTGTVRNCVFICRQIDLQDVDITDLSLSEISKPGIRFLCNVIRNSIIIASEMEITETGIYVPASTAIVSVSAGGTSEEPQELAVQRFPMYITCSGTVYLKLPDMYGANKINVFYVKIGGTTVIYNHAGTQIFSKTLASVDATTTAVFRLTNIGGNFFGNGSWVTELIYKI